MISWANRSPTAAFVAKGQPLSMIQEDSHFCARQAKLPNPESNIFLHVRPLVLELAVAALSFSCCFVAAVNPCVFNIVVTLQGHPIQYTI